MKNKPTAMNYKKSSLRVTALICALALCTAIFALPPKQITVPVWSKAIKLDLRGRATVYKSPSEDSPKLWVEANYWGKAFGRVLWSDEQPTKDVKIFLNDVKAGNSDWPLIATSDENVRNYLWYQIPIDGKEGWINIGGDVPSVDFEPIKTNENGVFKADNCYGSYVDPYIFVRQTGKYAGWAAFYYEDANDITGICLGIMADGMGIFPLLLPARLEISYMNYPYQLSRPEKGPYWKLRYPCDIQYPGGGNNFNKITDAEFEDLLNHANYSDDILIAYRTSKTSPRFVKYNAKETRAETITIPFKPGNYITSRPTKPKDLTPDSIRQIQNLPSRVIDNPRVESINPYTKVEQVVMQKSTTTLTMSFINASGIRQWNINRYAYITSDAAPGKKFDILRTTGVNLSPKPSNLSGNRNEKVIFSMTFDGVPLNTTKINLIEGPSKDNFHATGIEVGACLNNTEPTDLTDSPEKAGQIYTAVDESPSFPGGMGEMMKWIGQHLKYPPMAADRNIQGKVVVRFTVLTDGTVVNPQIMHPVNTDLDKEALRLIRSMPKWIPGKISGKAVDTYYTVPINFSLHH